MNDTGLLVVLSLVSLLVGMLLPWGEAASTVLMVAGFGGVLAVEVIIRFNRWKQNSN